MRFTCESCGSRYRLADEKVRGLQVEVRCRACGGVVTLRDGVPVTGSPQPDDRFTGAAAPVSATAAPAHGEADSPAMPAGGGAPPPPPEAQRLWFALVSGKQQGPLSDEALEREIAGGRIVSTTFVWHEGMSDWKRLADVPR